MFRNGIVLASFVVGCASSPPAPQLVRAPHDATNHELVPLDWQRVENIELGVTFELPSPEGPTTEPHTDEYGTWINHAYRSSPLDGLAYELTIKDYTAYELPAEATPEAIQREVCAALAQSLGDTSPRFEPIEAGNGSAFRCEANNASGRRAHAVSHWTSARRLFIALAVCQRPVCGAQADHTARFFTRLNVQEGALESAR